MSTFVPMVDSVQAFSYANEPMPDWWSEWAHQHPDKHRFITLSGVAIPSTLLEIECECVVAVARPGDYIVMDEAGDVFPMRKDRFEEQFKSSVLDRPGFRVRVDSAQRARALELIDQERTRQDKKWGDAFDNKNTANDWTTYIVHQLAKATPYHHDPVLFEEQMVKVAAVAVAAIETQRRLENLPPRHYDPKTVIKPTSPEVQAADANKKCQPPF